MPNLFPLLFIERLQKYLANAYKGAGDTDSENDEDEVKEEVEEEDITTMDVGTLKNRCRSYSISAKGNKIVLISKATIHFFIAKLISPPIHREATEIPRKCIQGSRGY